MARTANRMLGNFIESLIVCATQISHFLFSFFFFFLKKKPLAAQRIRRRQTRRLLAVQRLIIVLVFSNHRNRNTNRIHICILNHRNRNRRIVAMTQEEAKLWRLSKKYEPKSDAPPAAGNHSRPFYFAKMASQRAFIQLQYANCRW